ncbi:MAG: hypothetical protein ACI9LM_004754, partial [Alteromonadaceae bacterium]
PALLKISSSNRTTSFWFIIITVSSSTYLWLERIELW